MSKYEYLEPITDDLPRPLWSVMIPAYNCAGYLRETLQSVLQQDPGPELMQIEVIDDGSSDNPEAVVQELGRGRVGFYRQEKNVGHIRNFETALRRSRGRLIHLLHGDDRVLWGFYYEMGALFDKHPKAGAAFCRHYFMDAEGHQGYISPLLQPQSGLAAQFFEVICKNNIVQTPSMVVARSTYEQIGMFDHRLIYTEDWEMWTRIAKNYQIAYCTTPLAEYRFLNSSHTARTLLAGNTLKDLQMAQSIVREHAAGRLKDIKRIHEESLATAMWYDVKKLYDMKEAEAARSLFRKAWKLPMSFRQRIRLLKLRFRA